MSDQTALVATNGGAILDGIEYNVRGAITRDIANTYGRKTGVGDPDANDHPIHSTWTQSNWSGGGQIRELNIASDVGRFWWATADTAHPGYIIPPPKTITYAGPNTNTPVIIGDYAPAGTTFLYADWNGQLRKWNPSTDTWADAPNDLPNLATDCGQTYLLQTGASAGQMWLFVPGGGSASIVKPDETTANVTNGAVGFAVWDQKLFRLRANGAVEWTDDGTTWTVAGQITDGSTPKKILEGWDRNGTAVLNVITDCCLYVLDFDATKLRRSELKFPRHPDQGNAAVEHMGEGLYVSVGMGLHRIIGDNVISDQGLDRKNGVPQEYKGIIKSLASSYGLLFALTEAISTTTPSTLSMEAMGHDLIFDSSSHNALMMVWTGQGWHYRWAGNGMSASNLYVSNAGSQYRVWWGAGGLAMSQKLSRTYFNPYDVGEIETENVGDYWSGFNDWGLADQPKLGKVITVKTQGCNLQNTVDVYYNIGGVGSTYERLLGTITSSGIHRFYLGWLDGNLPAMFRGEKHTEIEIHLRLNSSDGDPKTYPRVRKIVVAAKKIVRPQRTWRFVADLTNNYQGKTPQEMMDLLEDLVEVHDSEEGTSVPFTIGDRTFMVDIVGCTFQEKPSVGQYYATISLIEALEMDAGISQEGEYFQTDV